jgi:hypothetical protein
VSGATWISRLRERPIADSERHAAMAAIVVLLAGTALVLAHTPAGQPRAGKHPVPSSIAVVRAPAPPVLAPLTVEAARATQVFLAGYLAHLYGHRSSAGIQGATRSLTRSLAAHAPPVPPEMRERQPRVVALRPAAAPAGLLAARAIVNDGGVVDYPITLLLARHDGRLLVSAVEGA